MYVNHSQEPSWNTHHVFSSAALNRRHKTFIGWENLLPSQSIFHILLFPFCQCPMSSFLSQKFTYDRIDYTSIPEGLWASFLDRSSTPNLHITIVFLSFGKPMRFADCVCCTCFLDHMKIYSALF